MIRDAVVFLHGRGLGPESAAAVAEAFPTTDFLAPSGSVELHRGRTWFQNRGIGVAEASSVAAAEAHFFGWYEQQNLTGGPVWLCGFSNGGAFAGHLLMQHPQRFAGAALLSAPLVLPPWPIYGLGSKPVLYAHGGSSDTIVRRELYDSAAAYLTGDSGCIPTIRCYSAGHVISPEMVADLSTWFSNVRQDRHS